MEAPRTYSSSLGGAEIIHRASQGETLWAIARRYGVELEEVVRANRLSDATQIEVGQQIVIPERSVSLRANVSEEVATAARSGFSESPSTDDSEGFVWPLKGKVVSSFGSKQGGMVNKGIDIVGRDGADVFAARTGKVSFIHENLPGFGKTIIVDHSDGFATVYACLGDILVRTGQTVSQRQVIARIGDAGRREWSSVHFEVRRRQKPQNPFYYLP